MQQVTSHNVPPELSNSLREIYRAPASDQFPAAFSVLLALLEEQWRTGDRAEPKANPDLP